MRSSYLRLKNSEGFTMIYFLVGFIILAGVFGALFLSHTLLFQNQNKIITSPVPLSLESSTKASPSSQNNLPDQLKEFPIYPNATFDSKVDTVVEFHCPPYHFCTVSSFNYQTPDSIENILSWY